MKKRIELTVKTQVVIGKIISGIAWICAGICGFFACRLASIAQIGCFVAALGTALVLIRGKREKIDEMADQNLTLAMAESAGWMHYVLCFAAVAVPAIALLTNSDEWIWPRVMSWTMFILLGIMHLITGIIFVKLEAE